MKILGLTIDVPTCSSAVLLEDGGIVCGSPEERLNREKQSMKFPSQSISFCLKQNKMDIADLDAVAISWNPLINVIESTSSRLTSSNRHRGEMLYTVLANLEPFLKEKPRFMKQSIELGAKSLDIYYLNHHDCHAANAYYESGYREAVILTCDGYGENETASVSIGKDNVIERKSATLFPNSLGMFYGTITEYLGFRHDSDEWKVMALGAYGTFDRRLHGKLVKLVSVEDDFTIRVNTNVFQFNNSLTRGMYNQDLVEYLGVKPRGRNEPLLAEHFNLALATQKIFEEILFEWCGKIHGKFGVDNLCLGGGSFMNSVFNGKIAESGIFGNVYVPFAPNDAGGAIGAAYHLYFDVLKNERNCRTGSPSPYIGPSFDDEQVEKALRLYKCKYRKEENIGRIAARLISEGMVVGWFQGAMEFGERALGNRSILADPRNPDSKTKVNAVIKFREQFRPFAPSVLEEHAHEFFVLPRNGFRTPYMEKVFPIRKEKAPLIPSVTHADGTGRLQTVSRDANQKYYDMIRDFHSITGVPIVMNTSLNRNGEPIVCSPEDALAVFYGSGLDYMVLHDFLVEK